MATELRDLQRLAELLADPTDHRPLRPAPTSLVEHLGALQAKGALRSIDGNRVDTGFDALLLREGDDRAFPVRDGVADLLPGSAIELQPGDLGAPGEAPAAEGA